MGFLSGITSGLGSLGGAVGGIFGGIGGAALGGMGTNALTPGAPPTAPDFSQYMNQPMDPQLTAIQSRLNSMQNPAALQAEGDYQDQGAAYKSNNYQAKNYDQPLPEYDAVRNQATQKLNTQNSTAQDAIQRRFAGMGNMNSGSYAKAAQLQDQSNAENIANTNTQIGFQEAQTRRALQQQEAQKEFQSSEAGKGREFANLEAQNQRNFQGSQAVDSRNLQRQQFNDQMQNQQNQFNFEGNTKLSALDLQQKQAEMEAASGGFNAAMEDYKARHTGGLLGSGGFLGTGLGI